MDQYLQMKRSFLLSPFPPLQNPYEEDWIGSSETERVFTRFYDIVEMKKTPMFIIDSKFKLAYTSAFPLEKQIINWEDKIKTSLQIANIVFVENDVRSQRLEFIARKKTLN